MVMLLEMMLQDVRDEAFAKGQFLQTIDHLKRLMRKMNMTLDEAMNFLEIPEDERSKYISAIETD